MRTELLEPARSAPGGAGYLLAGFRLLREPSILPFFLIPLLVNMLVFGVLIVWSIQAFSGWSEYALGLVPNWLSFLEWLLWPVFVLFLLLVVFYGFAMLANLIAAPFNGLLAERVAARVRPATGSETTDLAGFLLSIPRSLLRELRKLLHFVVLAVLVLILAFIPPLTPLAPVLWFIFGAWTMALEYSDFQADNDGVSFRELKSHLQNRRGLSLGFGAATLAATMVPILNLAVMPAAVCGATLMWVERFDSERS